MRKQTTGTEILGSPLFTDTSAAEREMRKLPKLALTHLEQLRRNAPDADPDRLRDMVHSAFAIRPLVIHEPQSIRIEISPRDYLNDYNCQMSGHLHEALVPFDGHPLFWRQQPTTRTTFPYRGKVGLAAVRLRTFIDTEDYNWFKKDIEKALRHAREELASTQNSQLLIARQARGIIDRVLAVSL